MRVIESGLYRICNNKLIPFDFSKSKYYITSVRYKSAMFSKVDLKKYEGCVIDVFNGWHDIEITIYNTKRI